MREIVFPLVITGDAQQLLKKINNNSKINKTYLLARVFLLLRLRRRTRFFLHLALIFK